MESFPRATLTVIAPCDNWSQDPDHSLFRAAQPSIGLRAE